MEDISNWEILLVAIISVAIGTFFILSVICINEPSYEKWYCEALESQYIKWHCIKWDRVIHKFE